jgi:hypothetical protein
VTYLLENKEISFTGHDKSDSSLNRGKYRPGKLLQLPKHVIIS